MRYLLCVCIIFWVISSGCSRDSLVQESRVLVIHSYEASYVAYPEFNRMIAEEFNKRGIKADIRTYYLNCENYGEEAEIERISHLLGSLSGWHPDVILVNEDQATYSLLKTGHDLVKTVPIVFAGVSYPNWELLLHYPNVTGFHDKIDFPTNLKVIAQLMGKRQSIFTLLDSTFLDRKIREDIRQQLKGHKYFFAPLGMPLPEKKEKYAAGYAAVREVSANIGRSREGFLWNVSKITATPYLQIKRDYTTIHFSRITSNASFTAINEAFGYGENLIGGYFTPLSVQAAEQVEAAVRILEGAKLSDIPIKESKKVFQVDWDALKLNGISKDRIPPYYEIIHMPFEDRHPLLFWLLIASVITGVSALLFWLFFLYVRENRRKRKVLSDLEEEKESLSLAIEGGNTYAWKCKEDAFIFEAAFWESLGMHPRKLEVSDFVLFIHPDYRQVFDVYQHNRHEAGKYILQLRCDFNGKGYQWWEFRYSTVENVSGEIKTAGLILNIQDVKDREAELIQARELAEKAELKQSFLANMSHEIRTPLNAIVGFANILAGEAELSAQERGEYISVIHTNTDLLLKLINDILELSRIESGYMSFDCHKCSVSELIEEVYGTHKMLIPESISFLKEKDDAVLEIYVDKGRLTQVLTNFLNNAAKFTSKGYIKLGYKYIPSQGEVRIFVEDTGKGIPVQEQKMIFGRFYKQDEFAQGTGLGLSICKVIIEKLNGRIELESNPGRGSCFIVILPCERIL